FAFLGPAQAQSVKSYQIDAPLVVLNGSTADIMVKSTEGIIEKAEVQKFSIESGGKTYKGQYKEGKILFKNVEVPNNNAVELDLISSGQTITTAQTRSIPGWLSILPPLIAIALALIFKRVLPALFLGVWIGAWIATGLTLLGLWTSLLA